MKNPKNHYTGIASEYLVLSMLYRMELDACMCIGNTKNVDIIIKKNDTVITLDVKAVRGYSSLIVNNVKPSENHFICFVIYNEKFSDISYVPEFFIVPSQCIKTIQKTFKSQKRIFKQCVLPYKDKWCVIL